MPPARAAVLRARCSLCTQVCAWVAQADRGGKWPQTASEKKQFLQSLERGMAVIQVFPREHPLTLSEVARLTGITLRRHEGYC